ncbi:MAG TPA: HPr(Ser) kinase/phosphatase [Xanthomonadales bacterium]|nr:HPr(Ser) kinase/phosphatase [Xanthomonadales bacterium]
MIRSLTAHDLIASLGERLDLKWVGETPPGPGPAISAGDHSSRPALAGFLNLIHPNKIQVLGLEELTFLDNLSEFDRENTLQRLLQANPLVMLVGGGLDMPDSIARCFAGTPTALMQSGLPAHELVNYLQYHVARSLANRVTLHGVFLEVFTIGVHLSGESGCGKSELALELITRGHRLIADDAPEFTQISPDIIDGTCPEVLQDCLEVRGLGVMNVRQMFGDAAVKLNKFLRLIIQLELPQDNGQVQGRDRLRGDTGTQRVLELDIPRITLQVRAGRNLAVMVEAAARDFMLRMKGFDASAAFVERHAKLFAQRDEGLAP